MRSDTEPTPKEFEIPPRKPMKAQGVGSRKGRDVSVSKWKHPDYNWRVRWIEDGRRQNKGFKNKAEAAAWAERKENELMSFGPLAELTLEERTTVLETRAELKGIGMTLRDAVAMAIRTHKRDNQSITVGELVQKVIQAKDKAGKAKRYIQDLGYRLGRFRTDFESRPITSFTLDELTEWIRGLDQNSTSQNNFRRHLKLLFNYGVKRKYLSFEENPARDIEKAKVTESEIEILTPKELSAFIECSPEDLTPVIVIGAFAGLRRSEIVHLNWSEIDLRSMKIKVRAEGSKKGRGRMVDIAPNLAEWLKPYVKTSGKVWPIGGDQKFKLAKKNTLKEAGFIVPPNALRHSYGTYSMALHRNIGLCAEEMGNSPAIIKSHYQNSFILPDDAKAYWSIMPEIEGNVIEMNAPQISPEGAVRKLSL